LIAVGEIVGAHALRGLLRVRAYQPPAPSLAAGQQVVLAGPGGERRGRVTSAAPHGRGIVLLGLEGIVDRNAAEALAGTRVLVPAEDLAPPGNDEFYYHEVEGFRVDTTDGRTLGTLVETFSTGLHDVWTVRDGTREYLIPVVADVVRTIDRTEGRVVIHPMPGLLD
jgi:16S rRNA processing protein RimM